MSLTKTTLSAALSATATTMTVTSATGFAAGDLCKIDQEFVRISKTYTSGTTIPLDGRGLNGGVVSAHVSGTNVETTATATDWASAPPQGVVPYPITSPGRTMSTYSAAGAISLPTPGNDAVAIITGGFDYTVAAPTTDMDGSILYILSNAAATTNTVTFTGGLSGAGTSYDKITFNTSAPVMLMAMAVNGLWVSPSAVAIAGTVTNLIGTIG